MFVCGERVGEEGEGQKDGGIKFMDETLIKFSVLILFVLFLCKKADIRDELNKLCSHLSANLAQQCNDFVQTYTDELVEMLVADFNPQEVCAYLKMCASVGVPKAVVKSMIGGDIGNYLRVKNVNLRNK